MMLTVEERAKFHIKGTILRHGTDGEIFMVTDNDDGFTKIGQRKGSFAQVLGGRAIYIQDLQPEDIRIEEIAHALGMQVRWNGWVSEFYCVGQHSVYVCIRAGQIAKEMGLPPETIDACMFYGLMHDGSESYLGDIITPLKEHLPLYYELENDAQSAILLKLASKHVLTAEVAGIVKKADCDLLFVERDRLVWGGKGLGDPYPMEDDHPHIEFEDIDPDFHCWTPPQAKEMFIKVFDVLTQ